MKLSPVRDLDHKHSLFWLGTWSLGGEGFGPSDLRESKRTLEAALDAGVRYFDTAGLYAKGKSEELLGASIGSQREAVFLSSKGGLFWDGNTVQHDGSESGLRTALSKSLDRLNTDYLDLFQLHWPDPNVPITESLSALKAFKKEGLIRYWGVGNLSSKQIKAYISPNEFIPHQLHFNPIHAEMNCLKAGFDEGRCLNFVYSPFEQGLLLANEIEKKIGKKDLRNRNPYFNSVNINSFLTKYYELMPNGIERAARLILWCLSFKEVSGVIAGPRSVSQLKECLRYQTWIERLKLDVSKRDWVGILKGETGDVLWTLLNSRLIPNKS